MHQIRYNTLFIIYLSNKKDYGIINEKLKGKKK